MSESWYIVSTPNTKRVQFGTSDTAVSAQTLLYERYYYDANSAYTSVPNIGNLTKVKRHTAAGYKTITDLAYDDYGNVLSETDAIGNITAHEYDTVDHLFRVSTTNARGHSASTVWDTSCHAPTSVTDANGRTPTTSYDEFCRVLRTETPAGYWSETTYHNLGDPTQQYTETRARGFNLSSSHKLTTRQYFNGFGEVYKTETFDEADEAATKTMQDYSYNQRGKLRSETLPYFAGETVQTTLYVYDALNRPSKVTQADGNYSTIRRHAEITQPVNRPERGIGMHRRQHQPPHQRARTAFSAVSASRISPIITTSGSWRRMARKAVAKLMSISGRT